MAFKKSLTGQLIKDPVCHKTNQGQGRGSRASHRRKKMRGQGKP